MVNCDAKRYLREVNSWLPCRRRLKKQIIDKIKQNMAVFMTENPDCGYDAIVSRFGTPQQISSAYVDEQETSELLNDLRIKRKIVSVVVSAVAVLIAVWSVAMGMVYIEGHNSVNGTVNVVGIEVIHEETYPDMGD